VSVWRSRWGLRAVIAEERFDVVGEVGYLFPIDMDDQG
jgi:hypothetical protein